MASSEEIRKKISHEVRGPIARIKGLIYVKIIENRADEYDMFIFRLCDEVLKQLHDMEVMLLNGIIDTRLRLEEQKVQIEMMLQAEDNNLKRDELMHFRDSIILDIYYQENIKLERIEDLPQDGQVTDVSKKENDENKPSGGEPDQSV